MSKVLVLGDFISDVYRICKADRICPEAPVPVLTQIKPDYSTPGGMGLVVEQLKALIGEDNVFSIPGSISVKTRYFVGNHLVVRVDEDESDPCPKEYYDNIVKEISLTSPDILIISDYGKGGMDKSLTSKIMWYADKKHIPVFVDAKKNWVQYGGAFALFPNEFEWEGIGTCHAVPPHIIQKMGAEGCLVDGHALPLDKSYQVFDVTGAGDVFLAAFSAAFLNLPKIRHKNPDQDFTHEELVHCAKYANKVAARSVEFVGTHIVTDVPMEFLGIM